MCCLQVAYVEKTQRIERHHPCRRQLDMEQGETAFHLVTADFILPMNGTTAPRRSSIMNRSKHV